MAASPRRRGFTFVELLIVVAIMGILAGMLMAGAQKAREAARRISCINNLKQLGVAVHVYHDSFKMLPTENGTGKSLYALISPYIDQGIDLQAAPGAPTPVPSFLCPSRRNAKQAPGKRDYGYALSPNNGSIFDAVEGLHLLVVTAQNGTANTLLLSHLWMDPKDYTAGTDPTDLGWNDVTSHKRPNNKTAKLDADPTGSTADIGGPHTKYNPSLFADAHAQYLPYEYPQWEQIWNYLNTVEVTLP
jgi:prepilin-type N-terminal cleavage/methylation domain-containing protein